MDDIIKRSNEKTMKMHMGYRHLMAVEMMAEEIFADTIVLIVEKWVGGEHVRSVKQIYEARIPTRRKRGRPRKTWNDVMKYTME